MKRQKNHEESDSIPPNGVKTEKVMYRHGDTEVYGTLCYDEAVSASRPGILVVHSDPEEKRAHALAVEGYIALALEEGFYSEQLPGEGDESDLVKERVLQERFLAAFALLQDHKLTEKGKIAAIGYCWGEGLYSVWQRPA